MARIRTVKPELWTDPEFTECSLSARLLFIALLNFATDYGVLPDKPRQLKLQCLPADSCDIGPLISELIAAHFLIRCKAPNGENVLVIRTFVKNQKINRPSEGRWGDPANWGNIQGVLTEDAVKPHGGPPLEGKGRDSSEGKGSLSPRRLTLVQPQPSTRERNHVIKLVVDALRAARRTAPDSERAWRRTVEADVRRTDGDVIDAMLADGDLPEQIALFILGHGATADKERAEVDWCTTKCGTCEGDAWIYVDADGNQVDHDTENAFGPVPCPGRTA